MLSRDKFNVIDTPALREERRERHYVRPQPRLLCMNLLGKLKNYNNKVEYLFHCLPGPNAFECHICNVAAVAVDSLVCAIYNTISAEAMEYKPEHGWADISALEDAEQLDKVSNNEMIIFTLLFIIQVSGLRVSAAGAEGEGGGVY